MPLDPKHVSDETELLTAPLDTDVVYLERAGPPLASFRQKIVNLFGWLGFTKDGTGNIVVPNGKTLSFSAGYDGGVAGVVGPGAGPLTAGWTTVGSVRHMTVVATRVTANSIFLFTFQGAPDNGSGVGLPFVLSRSPGASFTVEMRDQFEDRPLGFWFFEPHNP